MMKTYLLTSRRFFTLLIIALCLMQVHTVQGTNINVSGTISAPVTWSADTVKVTGNVTVADGVVLTVNPGVKVIFQGPYSLVIQGSIRAIGTASQPILFTVGDTTGFANSTDTTSGWGGIRFNTVLASNDSSKFDHCRFMYGKAVRAGVLSNGGALYILNSSKLTVRHSSFEYCRATNDGAGIFIKSSGALISGNTFTNGKCARGGGIFCDNSWPRIENNTFKLNYATGMGGGVCIANASAPVVINNLFHDNLAYLGGGVAFINAGAMTKIIANTLTSNRANYGGGMSSIATDATFINNIIWGNVAAEGHEVTLLDPDSDPGFNYCDIQGGLAGFGGSGSGASYTGTYTNNLNMDPVFADTLMRDYQIKTISPCLDAGTPDTTGLQLPASDLASNPRINMNRVDMGAFERQQVVSVCGHITQNTIWNADTVKVNCDIIVDSSVILTVAPGVYVEMQGAYKIEVLGLIQAIGNESEKITFTAKNPANRWLGLFINTSGVPSDSSRLVFCQLSYATKITGTNGGAILINNVDAVLISHCLISNNLVPDNGGGVALNHSSPRIEYTIFTGNEASFGGGLFITAGSAPLLNGLQFNQNQASFAAAIYFEAGTFEAENLMISNNLALVAASAIYSDNATVRLINCIIVNNETGTSGGALTFYNSVVNLTNSNIANNNAPAPAISLEGTTLEMNNCILYGNRINTTTNGTLSILDTFCSTTIKYCDIEGDSSDFLYTGDAEFEGIYANNLDVLPGFKTPTAGAGTGFDGAAADWSLSACSPLFNAGTPNTSGLNLPLYDFGGYHRIFADTVDIGAYELIKPTVTDQPHDTAACSGNDVYFFTEVESTIDVTYQWQVKPSGSGSFVNATGPGAGTATYTVIAATTAMNGDQYQCVITADCSTALSTFVADLTVNTAPSILTQPLAVSVCQGNTASFSVTANGSNITYQWQQRPFGSSWSNCIGAGANTASYSIANVPAAANNYSYRCIINGSCPPADTTDIVDLTVKSLPAVVTQPTNQSLCIGGNASFTVSGSGAGIGYQWQESTDGGGSWNDMSGSTSTNLDLSGVTLAMNGYKYRCVISGDCTPDATSNVATLTVNTSPQLISAPSISGACIYSDVTISVQASGGNLTYQWQQKAPADAVWSNATGMSALTANYQILNVLFAMNGYKYRCQISGSCSPALVTDSVTLNVYNLPSFYVGPDTSIILSETITLDAGAGFAGYQWSTTETTQTIEVVGTVVGIGAHNYSCTVTDAHGCTNNDALIVTVIDDAGIEAANNAPGFVISPNPVSDHLTIHTADQQTRPIQIRITDLLGKCMLDATYEVNSGAVIDVATWPAGTYFIQIDRKHSNEQFIFNKL